MDKHSLQPFKVGQLAESRSFQSGFRGAWFRCKIKEISWKKGHNGHALEFFDFPDEKINWTKLYQVPPIYGKKKETKRQLMVRPQYPPICHEKQMPRVNTNSEVTVIVDGVWKVGDLVDWWTDGCYWSGRVTQILGNNKVQIELPPPPVGEGAIYEVFCKDLRPSLDWSPEHGWTVPTPMEGENCRRCARLIQPVNQGGLLNLEIHTIDEGAKDVQATAGASFDASVSSHISANSLPASDKSKHSLTMEMPKQPLNITVSKDATQTPETNMDLDMGDNGIGKTSWSDSVSSSHVRDASAETAGHTAGEEQYYCSGSSKKMRTGGSISLNSMCSDTLEAAILDLEELANRVKWLKGILEFGIPLSNAVKPSWKFEEHRASSTPK
uniref:Agenet domain-containing protein n=1 Tax=Davidia involucrata TaxID=16924 RepID=A0A5B6YYU9_DAVIN